MRGKKTDSKRKKTLLAKSSLTVNHKSSREKAECLVRGLGFDLNGDTKVL